MLLCCVGVVVSVDIVVVVFGVVVLGCGDVFVVSRLAVVDYDSIVVFDVVDYCIFVVTDVFVGIVVYVGGTGLLLVVAEVVIDIGTVHDLFFSVALFLAFFSS